MTIRISQPTTDRSPLDSNKIRTMATISSDTLRRDIWFDFPEAFAGSLTKLANPWLLAALPYGLQSGETIRMDMPVDAVFLENMRAWLRQFKTWFPYISDVEIEAPTVWSEEQGEKTFSFFSGGVDSWFTILRHAAETQGFPQVGKVDHTITAWGFDIPLSNRPAFDKVADSCRQSLEPFDIDPLFVTTNLREDETSWWKIQWGYVCHGLALATIGHFLAPASRKILIPSGDTYGNALPDGSHPYTDHLFSSSRTPFVHYHPLYRRIQKIECIARHPEVLRNLRVCWKDQSEKNCGACEKCVRTLRALEILGVLEQATSFDLDLYRSQRNKQSFTDDVLSTQFMNSLHQSAREHGCHELEELIRKNLATNRRIMFVLNALKALPGEPLAWRTKKILTRNMIR